MAFFKGKFYLLYGVLLYPQNYLYHIAAAITHFPVVHATSTFYNNFPKPKAAFPTNRNWTNDKC